MPVNKPHILTVNQFAHSDLAQLFTLADQLQPYSKGERFTQVLQGAVLANLFLEPSTRTRLSFGTAFLRLGGKIIEVSNASNTSLAKGESLPDTARVVSGYADVIVLRHPQAGAAAEFAAASRVPVINAGDGANEHPTQALLDLYTLQKELSSRHKSLAGLHLALVGDLKHSRTIHSLVKLLKLFQPVHLTLISPPALCLPEEIVNELREAGLHLTIAEQLTPHINQVDAIYTTRLQEERFSSVHEAQQYRGQLRLDNTLYQQCQPDTIILHPLPRDARPNANELSTDLDNHPNLAIFRQAENGLLIRMALFCLIFDVAKQVERFSYQPPWQQA